MKKTIVLTVLFTLLLILPASALLDDGEDFLLIEVSDSEKGVLDVQTVCREPESGQVYLRKSNSQVFASVRDLDNAEDKGFEWARIEKSGDHIFICVPHLDKFSDLVKDGLLPGHPYTGEFGDDNILILSGLKPEHMKLITSESKGVLSKFSIMSSTWLGFFTPKIILSILLFLKRKLLAREESSISLTSFIASTLFNMDCSLSPLSHSER